jgi:hypothetical protein
MRKRGKNIKKEKTIYLKWRITLVGNREKELLDRLLNSCDRRRNRGENEQVNQETKNSDKERKEAIWNNTLRVQKTKYILQKTNMIKTSAYIAQDPLTEMAKVRPQELAAFHYCEDEKKWWWFLANTINKRKLFETKKSD